MLPTVARVIATACLCAVATDTTPTLIVPNFRDLTIKTRVKQGLGPWERTTWYFKGARVREEIQQEPTPNWPIPKLFVKLTQCDKKSYYLIDEKEMEYEKRSVSAMAAKERDLLNGQPDDGEIAISYDSVETSGSRQIGGYEARHVRTMISFDPSVDTGLRPAMIQLDGLYIDLPGWEMCQDRAGTYAWAMDLATNHPRPRFIFNWHGARRVLSSMKPQRRPQECSLRVRSSFWGFPRNPLIRHCSRCLRITRE